MTTYKLSSITCRSRTHVHYALYVALLGTGPVTIDLKGCGGSNLRAVNIYKARDFAWYGKSKVIMESARGQEVSSSSPTVSIKQDHFMQRMDVERINFKKLFRDVRLHVDVGLKLYQAKRTDSDARFHDLFESLDLLLGSVQKSQEILSKGCSR